VSADFISRIVGMIVFLLVGLFVGIYAPLPTDYFSTYFYAVVFMLVGALMGLVLTPYFTVRPFLAIRRRIRQAPAQQLIAAVLGLILGLVVAALISFPLSLLPPPLSQILPFVAAVLFGMLGIMIMSFRQRDIFEMVRGQAPGRAEGGAEGNWWRRPLLLDTSVIIDGRIVDISRTGFIANEMLVPRFVLNELQHIADSSDALRRRRGRRGLDMLHRLQEESVAPIRITDQDIEDVSGVDDKLVLLARRLRSAIVTNDYNLNRVAELQGVMVLNVNELANAVKAVFLPGEDISLRIVRTGKEPGQGVGYLEDGTMVVVENGEPYVHDEVGVTVTKVLQTAAGRMLFARLSEGESSGG